jgi:TolB protein
MRRLSDIRKLWAQVFLSFFVLGFFHFTFSPVSHAKIYIDITSPAIRKLPISISSSGIAGATTVEEIIRADLLFTGIFSDVAPEIPGAEVTVKIELKEADGLKAALTVTDLIRNREVLRKRYEASKKVIRALAHSISNDVFKVVTGRNGAFRTRIAYIMERAGKKELHLMDWDGYNSRRVISSMLTSSHNWSQDGRHIVYSSVRKRKWEINMLDLIRYKKIHLFTSEGLNLVGNMTGDNRLVFSSSKRGSSEIYTMDVNSRKYRRLTGSYGIDVSPAYSPDASEIVYVSDQGGNPHIYIMASDGSGKRRLTFEGNYNTSPAWTPDGKEIVFVGRKNGKNQIFMIKSDGTDLRQITSKGNNEEPTFSPNGIFIAFDSDRDGERGIYVMRSNGEEQKRITPPGTVVRAPRWSPYK